MGVGVSRGPRVARAVGGNTVRSVSVAVGVAMTGGAIVSLGAGVCEGYCVGVLLPIGSGTSVGVLDGVGKYAGVVLGCQCGLEVGVCCCLRSIVGSGIASGRGSVVKFVVTAPPCGLPHTFRTEPCTLTWYGVL